MIKRFVVLRKRTDMSVEELRNYWQTVHGPLIGKIPGLKKYVQYHVTSEVTYNTEAPIDGIAELWFESIDTQKSAYSTPQYRAVVEDEPNLFETSTHYVHPVMTDKTVIIVDDDS